MQEGNIIHGNKKDAVTFFANHKSVRTVLGNDFVLSELHQLQITEFFEYFNDGDRSGIWRKNIAIWIKHGIGGWIDRRKDLCSVTSNSKEWYMLMYGSDGLSRHSEFAASRSRLPSTVEYWLQRGFSPCEASVKVSESQTKKAVNASIKLKGSQGRHSIRSAKYWVTQHGYTELEAHKKAASTQRRDLDFFVAKYGIDAGITRFEQSKAKRKSTWETKDKLEHAIKTAPNRFNATGQEIQAIQGFLAANNIPSANCKYGAPNEQHTVDIPGVGIRRYDLAVFTDCNHSELTCVLEYHGPGHINFSDYAPVLKNERITVAGKQLLHLGTYGAAFNNDTAKRNFILSNHPTVLYLVMWTDDLINKRFTIDELL